MAISIVTIPEALMNKKNVEKYDEYIEIAVGLAKENYLSDDSSTPLIGLYIINIFN